MVSIVFPTDQGYSLYPATIPPYVAAILFETFLYGLYIILFAICLYVLIQRNKTAHWVLLTFAIAMFVVATTDIIYTYYLVFGKLFIGGVSFNDLRPKYWLYVTNNVLADSLLVYRCYAVWERKMRIVVGPIILLVAGTVCGYIFEGSQPQRFAYAWIYLTMTLTLNVILTMLIAGRIGWFARKAKLLLGQSLLQRYNGSIAIMIESGCLYSLYVGLDLAMLKNKIGHTVLDAGLIQAVGIMPTLIIVQVGLGRAVSDFQVNTDTNLPSSIASLEINKNRNLVPDGMLSEDCCHCASKSNDTVVYRPDVEG